MKVRGIAMWAKVHEAVDQFGDDKPKFSIDLIVEDKKELKRLKEAGISPKKKKSDDGHPVFTFSTLEKDKEGNTRRAPTVVDRSGHRSFYEHIGNGSDVVVMFTSQEWHMKNRTGVKGYLNGVQVLNHVPYGESFDAYDDEGGDEEESNEGTGAGNKGTEGAKEKDGGDEDFWDSQD